MTTSEQARDRGSDVIESASEAGGTAGSPDQLGDLERPAVVPEGDAVRGGALPPEQKRQIAQDMVRVS